MNTANAFALLSPQFSVLNENQIRDIHLAALEVLRRTGIRFHHPGALDMLKQAGAYISDGNLVKFPARLIKEALASAPERIIMCDREGEAAVFLEGRKTYFGTGSDTLNYLDPRTGEYRKYTQADLIDAYHVVDALPNIHFLMSIGIPTDVVMERLYDVQMALMLEHTTKPLVFVTNDYASCRRAIDMAAAVAGGQEALQQQQHILLYSEPSSPLQQSETAVDKLLLMAETQLPVVHSPAPQMGALAPVTMAGGLVMCLAEILSSLVVHQLKQPGAPFVIGAGIHHMDMKSAQICYGSPEFQLTKAAIAQIGQWYRLPTWGYAGCSDAKILDEQAAVESLLAVMMAKLSGGNLIHDVGYLESGLTASLEMIVLTDELVAMVDNLLKGIEVTPDTLMLDEIHNVGPGGHFLTTEATLSHFKDYWYPDLMDRYRRKKWLDGGAKTLSQRLNDKVLDILDNHQVPALSDKVKERVWEIAYRAG